MRRIFLTFGLALLIAGGASVFAADPPPNNNFTNRFVLTGSSLTVTGSNVSATKETGEPTIRFNNGQSNTGGKSIWWGWTPDISGTARVTMFGSSFDTIMAVYTGSVLNSLTWVGGNDDANSGTQSMLTFNVTAGTQYQITVDGWNGNSGTVVVNMHVTNTPPSVFMASPTNGATYTLPATVLLTVYGSDFVQTNPTPTGVTNVDFYQDGVKVRTVRTATSSTMFPTNISLGVGTYTFTAVSFSRRGITNLSPAATINVIDNVPPTVSVTSPADGATFNAPLNLSVLATASDLYGGTVTNVEFYTNSVKLGQDTTSPYSNYWGNVPVGTHTLTAMAYDNGGLSTVSTAVTITVNPNVPPTVSIFSPANGANFSAPATIIIGATATDNAGGSITNVEFYADAIKLGQDTTNPYSFSWGNVAVGAYSLTAVAWDNGGLSTVSGPISITVNPNTPPTVSLTSPTDNQSYAAPASVAFIATASDPDGTVTNVEFYANGSKVGQDTTFPFSFIWTNVFSGSYSLTAVAYDNGGLTTTSTAIGIVVSNSVPPVVNITSPVTNATFTAGLDLTILATASDSDGTVSKVEFYQSTTKLGESTNSPFSFTWSNVVAGSYSLRAVATDNSSTKATSAVINVTIGALAAWQTNLVPGESIWKYLDNGTDQGTAWRGTNFNDNGWASGKAQLGYGDGDEVTVVSYGPDSANKYITTYFRRSLFLTNAYRYSNLTLRVIRDDGVVVYINSNEVFRSNIPDSPTYLTTATLGIGGLDESITWYTTNFQPGTVLRSGTNVIAVEMHQNVGTSTDLSFDLELIGDLSPATNVWPTVALISPTGGATFYPPVTIALIASASDVDGTVTNVDFYANGTRLGRDQTSIYSLSWTNPAPGSYTLVAVAYDNTGATNTSAPINISVVSGSPPSVTLTAPTNSAVFNGPTNLLLQATASDSDGTVARVEFLRDTTSLGSDTTNPYQWTWTNAIAGSYTLRAVATDNNGLVTTSAPVAITITTGGMLSTWVAFNDHSPGTIGSQTSPNATTINGLVSGSSGSLKNILDGSTLPATMTVTIAGSVTGGGTAEVPAAGTPLANTFDGFVYFGTVTSPAAAIQTPATTTVTYTFSGLDPNKRYTFQGGAVRGGSYPDRWTLMDILGANSVTPNHQQGANSPWGYLDAIRVPSGSGAPTGYQVAMNFGDNRCGDMVEYDNIDPGSDGAFAITCTQYQGPVPCCFGINTSAGTSIGSAYSYSISGLRLEEFSVSGPMVIVTSPTNNQICVLPGSVQINANVSRFSGTVTNVAFYNWPTKLGDDTSAPYSFTWNNPAAGTYTLRAVASDTTGVIATSSPVTIRVQANVAPTVAMTSPTDGSVMTAPANITINVAASDPDDGLASVDYYVNDMFLGRSTLPPFTFNYLNAPVGNYDFNVIATDNHGLQATSSTARVFVMLSSAASVASFNPPPGVVSNLTQVTVQFTQPVDGVDVSDLLLNGKPASSMVGSNYSYTFSFPRPLEGVVIASWAANHGIVNREIPPKPFNGQGAGETAQYIFTDTVPPQVALTKPIAGAQVPSLTEVEVTFSEPVIGVDAEDLLVNGVPATKVNGSLAGPYVFKFDQPTNGLPLVQLSWAANHGIHDLAQAQNAFAGPGWSYTLDTSGALDRIVINEIMYHPVPETGEDVHQEWLELHNASGSPVNLVGWRLTKAVKYTFGDVTIPAQGYLVVAADVAVFHTRYPAVNNVVGNWVGGLGNNGDTIQLENALGDKVNEVSYATQGDWAKRLRAPEERQAFLTRSGNTVTATVFAHDWAGGDYVWIYGADQSEFNGVFTISGLGVSTFTYTAAGSTPSATGVVICRRLSDRGYVGWGWSSLADGLGRSMELRNDALPNDAGQNWDQSAQVYGTPGAPNSVATNNIPPMILEAQHFPLVPRSTDTVDVTARIVDELTSGITARLWYRNVSTYTPTAWTSANLVDDGGHADGFAGDTVFGGQIPAQANRAVMEFYIEATDAAGNRRTWPQPALGTNNVALQWANALYQVDDGNLVTNQPVYRLILSASETNELKQAHDSQTQCNLEVNATFISLDGVESLCRYNAGVRNRGGGSRSAWPMNYWVGFPNDRRWKGKKATHLNTQYTHSQAAGYALGVSGGIDVEYGRVVQVRVNGNNLAHAACDPNGGCQYGSYTELQSVDTDYAHQHWPDDPGGNLYRMTSGGHSATLTYINNNPSSYATDHNGGRGYYKASNTSENDWSDLLNLMAVLNTNTANPTVYAQAVSQVVNVAQWMRYMAVWQLLGSGETAIQTGQGDDYAMYRGVKDPRFILLSHDFDTILNQGQGPGAYNRSLFIMSPFVGGGNVPVMNQFMTNAAFVPLYYQAYDELLNSSFSLSNLSATLDQTLGNWPASAALSSMKQWYTNRYNWVRSQIPTNLTVTHSLALNSGYPYTTSPTVALGGAADIIKTRSVLVNGNPSSWSAWQGLWTSSAVGLQPGINRVLVQSLDADRVVFAQASLDIWYDDSSSTSVSGAINGAVIWTPGNGPYNITASVTVGNGATLTIQPGTTVFIAAGATVTASGSGRILAEGTALQHIRLTRVPGAGNWGSLDFIGATNESRLAYVDIDGCGGTTIGGHNAEVHVNGGSKTFFEHMTFTNNPVIQYISFDASSFIVQNCTFPTYPYATSGPEMLHGVNGINTGGYGIFRDNYFGHTWGASDTIDFTGGNRPGPILQIIGNVFDGASDDHLDLDSTDAWIEGNIFMHAHRDINSTSDARDTSSAISGGVDFAGVYSEWTIINNLFYDVDHACLNKQGGRFIFVNNTLVHVNKESGGGLTSDIAAFDFTDNGLALPDPSIGAGAYVAGNIIWDCPMLVANYNPANHTVIFENNILPLAWSGPGANNVVTDPMLNLSLISNVGSATWQTVKAAFTPRPGSPALGTGIGGFDKGGFNPNGILVYGEPAEITSATSATLTVAPGGTFNWGTVVPPYLWGYTHYKWKLDNGPWSAELPITTSPTISLSSLSVGPHTVYVTGKNDAGSYQDDSFFYPASAGVPARVTASRTWIVNPNAQTVRINEVLAWNDTAVPVGGRTPDLIELYNRGPAAVDLSGMSISDSLDNPQKYVFPPGSSIGAGAFLVLYADNESTPLGHHLGFALGQDGDEVYLFSALGELLDSVVFGQQVADLSIGRLAGGTWALNYPTFGAANRAAPVGDVHKLRINEWLTHGVTAIPYDFVELFNPDSLPVDLGGLYLTDNQIGAPALNQVPPLSFVRSGGFPLFYADNNPSAGRDHLNFRLSGDRGVIALLDQDLNLIDFVLYGPQYNDVSQGRSPSGSGNIVFFATPTPGGPNPAPAPPTGSQVVINEVLARNTSGLTNIDGGTPGWIEMYNPTASPILLADMSLSTNSGMQRLFVFPSGTLLPVGGFMVVLFDPSQPPSSNAVARPNTGFGLKDNGGTVFLFDKLANGGAQIDAIAYGVQANDWSIGRLPNGSTNWALNQPTPGNANAATVLGDRMQIRINEWMAAPLSGEYDWFELYNANAQPVDISGLYLTDDVTTPATRQQYQIAPLSFIGTGLYGYVRFWADKALVGPDHVNFALGAAGEYLGLTAPGDVQIDTVRFLLQDDGVSEGRLPDGSTNIVRFPATPTPADANYLPLTSIVINEVLSAVVPNSSYEQAIELLNVSTNTVNLGGWYISNMKHDLRKYRITNGLSIGPGQFKVFYEYQFNFDPRDPACFKLDVLQGDNVYLAVTDINGNLTGYRTSVDFGPAEPGVSFGRFTNSVRQVDFTALSRPTFGVDNPDGVENFREGTGAANAYPLIGPIVFSEILYHPPDLLGADNVRDEYLRLLNITSNTVQLYDPLHSTNTWHLRGGVDFNLPASVSLGAAQSLLLVSFDPVSDLTALAGFRSAHPQLATNIPLYGPYTGKLDNGGESIKLNKPGTPVPAGQLNAGDVPYILAEYVKYDDVAPWDPLADGSGASLLRIDPRLYGNDPNNWYAANPQPGPQSLDSDGDGIQDWWMYQYFGHATGQAADQSRASDDPDHDGMTNLQEYRAGTEPTNPQSRLRVFAAGPSAGGGTVILSFGGVAGKAYSVEYQDTLLTAWQNLANINTLVTNGTVWVTNQVPLGISPRFYRVIIP